MIFVRNKNVWGPKYQKGILHPIGFWNTQDVYTITLSGSSGTPNVAAASSEGGTATAGWRWVMDGTMDRKHGSAPPTVNWTNWVASPDEWVNPNRTPDEAYYIKFTYDSGSTATTISHTAGTYAEIDSGTRYFTLDRSTSGSHSSTYRVDISTTTNDTGIVATGYYRNTASWTPAI